MLAPADRREHATRHHRLLLAPDRQFVAAGVFELEAAAARELKDLCGDLASRVAHVRDRHPEIIGIQHDQGAAG